MQQMQEISSKKEKAVTKLVTNLASGFESIVDAHEQLGSVASSSQRRSQQALRSDQKGTGCTGEGQDLTPGRN